MKNNLAKFGVFYTLLGADLLLTARTEYGKPLKTKMEAEDRLSEIRASVPTIIRGQAITEKNQHTLFVKSL